MAAGPGARGSSAPPGQDPATGAGGRPSAPGPSVTGETPEPVSGAGPAQGLSAGLARGPRWLRRGLQASSDYVGVGGLLAALIIYLSIAQGDFATQANWINIAQTNAVLLVLAAGLTFVLLVGGFDLSIGGTLALSSVVFYQLLNGGMSFGPALVLMILLGAACGLINGVAIAGLGMSFLVVTLATASIYRGVAQVMTDGQSKTLPLRDSLTTLGSGTTIGGVPWSVVIALGILVVGVLLLRYSGFGRMVYAVGGNPEAARLAGINTTVVRAAVYVISGALAAVAGVLQTTMLTAATPSALIGVELTAGAAVLLGGTTFMGGKGTILGTFLGVLFLGVLQNGITLVGISAFWQLPLSGAVLVVALLLQRLRGRSMP